jgi:hypothetical protein
MLSRNVAASEASFADVDPRSAADSSIGCQHSLKRRAGST